MDKLLRSPRISKPLILKRFHSTNLLENSVSNSDNRLRLHEEKYTADMSTSLPPTVKAALNDLAQETLSQFGNAHMMVPETQGSLLHQLVKLFGAQRILEIGTFTGSSTLAMASALKPSDKLVTLERDPKPQEVAKRYIHQLNLEDRVDMRLGKAMESLIAIAKEEPRPQYDMVFIDADKKGYIPYYDFIIDNDLLSDRGLIIADNVLFFGQVHRIAGYEDDNPVEASKNVRKIAKYAHDFNKHVLQDSRVQVVVLPLFDGVSIISKTKV
ncbi:O-methyltransferase-domain-containing protein [Zychaea mexicana]|uniref:O-methyltransferase-domain-containing protein n=1 Tax=Zychaea mexicana TaxID=64656 RepID=UPI0022FF197E|nr:O-methyltransferase-domain-containing protein [Zychaea mexicana]KAI9491074.1 O-methyltransferase-domain-containing protein [Zychaea mexicana]